MNTFSFFSLFISMVSLSSSAFAEFQGPAYYLNEDSETPASDEMHILSEQPLLSVVSDAMEGEMRISTLVNADFELQGVKFYAADGVVSVFDLQALKNGVTLYATEVSILGMGKRTLQVVQLKTPEVLNPKSGGVINLIYLYSYNPLFKKEVYKTYPMDIGFAGDKWSLSTDNQSGRVNFTKMTMLKNTFMGRTNGIKEIKVE